MGVISPKLRKITNGIAHWCPGCKNIHPIAIDAPNQSGARWTWDGNVDAPTLSPSVNVVGHCHYFLKAGQIQFLSDCRHALAGQTVHLPDFPVDEDEWLDAL